MTNVSLILEELRRGESIAKIRERFRSQTQIYEAVRAYLQEAQQTVPNLQDTLTSLRAEVKQTRESVASLNSEARQISSQNEVARTENADLEKKRNQTQSELDAANQGLEALSKLGITPQTISRVQQMEAESESDLLEAVMTAADHKKIRDQLAKMNREKAKVEKETGVLRSQKEELKTEAQSCRNLLDELKRETANFKSAVEIADSFLKAGYDADSLKLLRQAFERVGVKRNPALTLNRLVRALEKTRTLSGLDDLVAKGEKELETLEKGIEVAKGELNAHRDAVLRTVNEAAEKAINQIERAGEGATAIIEDVKAKSEKSLVSDFRTMADNQKNVNNMLEQGSRKFSEYMENVKKNMQAREKDASETLNSRISSFMDNLGAEMEKAKKLNDEAARHGELLKHAYCLLGILKIPDAIKEVPLSLIAQLADRINTYVEIHFADEVAKPSVAVRARTPQFHDLIKYRLSGLSLWLKEELEKRTLERSRLPVIK